MCLEGVWKVSGRYQRGVWTASKRCLDGVGVGEYPEPNYDTAWNRGQNSITKLTAPCSYKVESVRKDVVRQDTKDDIINILIQTSSYFYQ